MLVVHVYVHVKLDRVDAFREASLTNARCSLEEPGVVRFDVIQENERPDRFMLVEVYRTADDPARHKETEHYAVWRDAVADMMESPRRSVKYHEVFPEAPRWETPG
jgi:autoinducer 2-degrading protein